MIIPIRCFTCDKPIAHLWETYCEEIKTRTPNDVLNELGLTRYCCRRMLLTHVDIIDKLLKYANNPGEIDIIEYD